MEQKILDKIILKLISNIPESDHSLMQGKSGILIALSYYYSFSLNKKLKKTVIEAIHICIDEILEDIESNHIDSSLAHGITGIAYAFRTAYELGHKDKIDIDWFEDLDSLIIDSLEYFIEKKEYDLLRGSSGIIIYLLKYNLKKNLIEKYIESLYKEAIWEGKGKCYWIFYSFNEMKNEFEYRDDIINLGLAHGISGIISILSELFKKGIKKEKCFTLISGAINFLKTIESSDNISQFCGILYKSIEYQNSSRLGWCYGDSSLGLSILKAGVYTGNYNWIEYGNKICLKSTNRTFEDANLDEHGVCHGFFGTMHIYNRLHKLTNIVEYKDKKEYWYKIAMEKRDPNVDGLGFFQTEFLHNGIIKKYTSYGLLQGLAGIFLCLVSFDKIEYSWDSIFLINIEKN